MNPPTIRPLSTLLLLTCALLLASSAMHAQTCNPGDFQANQSNGTVSIGATGTITTTGTLIINGSASVTYTAGTAIKLENGFHAGPGTANPTFHAIIQTCTPNTTTVKEYIRLGNRIIAIENH